MMSATNKSFRPLCRNCGSGHTRRVKKDRNQFVCQDCGNYFTPPTIESAAFGGWTEIEGFVPGTMSNQELMEHLNIDGRYWRIGRVLYGRKDTYKGDTITPMVNVKVWIVPKVEELTARSLFIELLEQARDFSPRYPKIKYPKVTDGVLYEIGMPDIHLGLLAWAEESGMDSDLKLTVALVHRVIDQLLAYSNCLPVERILLPIGNDFFNVNNKDNTTIHGTPQQEDTRYQKTFRKGCELMVDVIDKCATVAPVEVVVVPGNHDEERSFYMGEVLSAWYRNCPNVTVDNRAMKRKYVQYGVNLIGLTHGYYEKFSVLTNLMPLEVPEMWASTKYREWHLGDKHHKKDMQLIADEKIGMVIRILRSLSAPSAWAFDKGFLGSLRAGEGFVWHPTKGLIAQFTAAGDL
jgi:hypothetical protein